MRLLLDTHILLAVVNGKLDRLPMAHRQQVLDVSSDLFSSTARLWEIAIKVRLGKLELAGEIEALETTCTAFNIAVLSILPRHALTEVVPEPATRDPFDRLLLAQASVEGMRLLTLDRALIGPPFTWAPPQEQPAP